MRAPEPRCMRFDVRPVESDASGRRWHWLVFDEGGSDFVRNGQTLGEQDGAESVARAVIALLGGTVRDAPR